MINWFLLTSVTPSVYSLLWLSPWDLYFVECDCPVVEVKRELIKVAEEVLIWAFSGSSSREALLIVRIAQHIPFIINSHTR